MKINKIINLDFKYNNSIIKSFISILIIDILAVLFLFGVMFIFKEYGCITDIPDKANSNTNILVNLIAYGIFIPLIEEIIFRLPLKIYPNNIITTLLILLVSTFLYSIHDNNYLYLFMIVLLVFGIFLYSEEKTIDFLKRNYLIYAHLISLIFAILHVYFYIAEFEILFIIPLFLFHIVFSYCLYYLRVGYGLKYSILLHVMHNSTLFLLAEIIE